MSTSQNLTRAGTDLKPFILSNRSQTHSFSNMSKDWESEDEFSETSESRRGFVASCSLFRRSRPSPSHETFITPSFIVIRSCLMSSRAALKRFGWRPAEDAKLRKLVQTHGDKNWAVIADELTGREPKQCRERWINHLAPGISKGRLSDEEWKKVQELQIDYGNRSVLRPISAPLRIPSHLRFSLFFSPFPSNASSLVSFIWGLSHGLFSLYLLLSLLLQFACLGSLLGSAHSTISSFPTSLFSSWYCS